MKHHFFCSNSSNSTAVQVPKCAQVQQVSKSEVMQAVEANDISVFPFREQIERIGDEAHKAYGGMYLCKEAYEGIWHRVGLQFPDFPSTTIDHICVLVGNRVKFLLEVDKLKVSRS